MIFARHDFTENFFNAVGFNDKFMETNILIDELARIIVDNKKSVVDALRSIGVNAAYKDNNDTLKNFVVKEIKDGNDKIINFLAGEIVKNQVDEAKLKQVIGKFNIGGKLKKADGSVDEQAYVSQQSKAGQLLSAIISNPNVQQSASTLIADSLKNLFAKNNTNSTSNDQQLAERLKLNQMQAANTTPNKYVALKVIGAIILAGGIGYIIYYLATKNSGGSTAAPAPPAPTASQ